MLSFRYKTLPRMKEELSTSGKGNNVTYTPKTSANTAATKKAAQAANASGTNNAAAKAQATADKNAAQKAQAAAAVKAALKSTTYKTGTDSATSSSALRAEQGSASQKSATNYVTAATAATNAAKAAKSAGEAAKNSGVNVNPYAGSADAATEAFKAAKAAGEAAKNPGVNVNPNAGTGKVNLKADTPTEVTPTVEPTTPVKQPTVLDSGNVNNGTGGGTGAGGAGNVNLTGLDTSTVIPTSYTNADGTTIEFDPDANYQDLINYGIEQSRNATTEEEKYQWLKQVAEWEQQRNAKIAATGSTYAQTNIYSPFLDYEYDPYAGKFAIYNPLTGDTEYYDTQQEAAIAQAGYTQQYIDEQTNLAIEQLTNQNNYTTNSAISELEAQIEEAGTEYDAQRLEQEYLKRQNADNQALYNAAAGDTGGLGQKQYSDSQAAYDQALYEIDLEEQNLKNAVARQVADLRAQGEYELANAVLEAGMNRISQVIANANAAYSNSVAAEQEAYDRSQAEKEAAYSKAITNIQLGMLSSADIEALGVSASQAQQVANYYNQLAQIDLAEAKAGLASLYNNTGSSSYSSSSSSSTTTSATDNYFGIDKSAMKDINSLISSEGISFNGIGKILLTYGYANSLSEAENLAEQLVNSKITNARDDENIVVDGYTYTWTAFRLMQNADTVAPSFNPNTGNITYHLTEKSTRYNK